MNGKLLNGALLAVAVAALTGAKPLPMRLDVTGQPEGAKVFVDGTLCGTLHGETSCTVTPLEPGRHLLHVEAPFYRPFDEYLRLDESENFVSKAVDLEPERGLVLVKTKPAGATVTCRGSSLGTTPLLVTTLPCGPTYTLELSLNGYQKKRVEIRTTDRTPLVRDEELVLDSGLVYCTTEPAGATVLMNGIDRGVTPVEVMVPRGGAVLTFRLDGYQDAERSVGMSAGERQTLAVKMEGRPARLTVVTEPEKAKVFLDENYQGKSPVTISSAAPGAHEIRVELPGHAPLTRTVQLVNGGDATETFKLESVLGRLEVITTPAGAKISVDGKVEGVTRAQGDSEKSRILMIEKIAAGEHAVFAHLDGYLDVSRKVVVDAKETKQLYISLKRNFTPDTEVETINGAPVRGVLVKEKTTEEQLVLELRPGVEQAIRRETIRKITNLKE